MLLKLHADHSLSANEPRAVVSALCELNNANPPHPTWHPPVLNHLAPHRLPVPAYI